MNKKFIQLLVVMLFFCFSPLVFSDSTELVDVVKVDTEQHDLVVERASGERLFIQYQRMCTSISTQYPVNLVWKNHKLVSLKVASNEQCKVYQSGVYSGEVLIKTRIKPTIPWESDHLAEVEWGNGLYQIDFETGCGNMRNFIGKNAAISLTGTTLDGGKLFLPGNQGSCRIKSSTKLSDVSVAPAASALTGVSVLAENNSASFAWNAPTDGKKRLYLIGWSYKKLDPALLEWNKMPHLKTITSTLFTSTDLTNNRSYYFYLSARSEDGVVAPWTELVIKPVSTLEPITNNPDPELFEVRLDSATDAGFNLNWDDKSAKVNRYLAEFYVNGKRIFLKVVPGTSTSMTIDRKPEYKGSRYRFTLKSLNKKGFAQTFFDGVYWEDKN